MQRKRAAAPGGRAVFPVADMAPDRFPASIVPGRSYPHAGV